MAATPYGIDASPWPRGVLTVTHPAFDETAHAQSRAAAIESVPLPPVAVNDVGTIVTPIWHLSAVGDTTEVSVDVHAAAIHADTATEPKIPQRIGSTSAPPMHGAGQIRGKNFSLGFR